jgi:hypothetical protein
MDQLNTFPTTGEVARQHELSEGQLNSILRRIQAIKPPIIGGRRRWRPEDVRSLEDYLARVRGLNQ